MRLDLSGAPEVLTILSGRESAVRRLDLLREAVGDEPADWYPALTGRAWPGAQRRRRRRSTRRFGTRLPRLGGGRMNAASPASRRSTASAAALPRACARSTARPARPRRRRSGGCSARQDGALLPALTILLTLYVAFFAFSLITGRCRLGISALTPRMITLGLVLTFATSWIAYQSVGLEPRGRRARPARRRC